ncbi:unnamed protein product [Bemisia tabaci]|uniref:RNB domain-containing protein n=1 Tax=Bemisia tabaci TaxID=7038 RepID=A0A9P0A3J3_BEMTA|nr:unnamed protein product [Bemisia tabaci]
MTSKADRAALAISHEKNKQKLTRTISKVVKSLSALDLDEKNEELRNLQRQLRTLDKQLGKVSEKDPFAEKKESKKSKKKSKKSKVEKEPDDGGRQIGAFRLLPLGIGVKAQVKSKTVNSSLSEAVTKRTKNAPKEITSKFTHKKLSGPKRCSELVDEYINLESRGNVKNQKKSKKEKKKLKTLKEISIKMEKCSPDEQKISSCVKIKEKNLGKNKKNLEMKESVSKMQPIVNTLKIKDKTSGGNEHKLKKTEEYNECKDHTFSNLASLSEQYYFLTAVERTIGSNLSAESETVSNVINKTKKNKKKKKQNNCSLPIDPIIERTDLKTLNKLSEIEQGVSTLSICNSSMQTGVENSIPKKEKKKKKKKKAEATDGDDSNMCSNEGKESSGPKRGDEKGQGFSSLSLNQEQIERKDKKKKSKKNNEKKTNKEHREPEEDNFENYLSEIEVTNGLQGGTLVSGQLRINARDYTTAYVSSAIESEPDYLIEGVRNRNRALEGDTVILSILPQSMWKSISSGLQKTAKVVYIKELIHSRRGIGTVRVMADKNPEFALFSPNDSRLPRWQVPMYCCPPDFYSNSTKYKHVYFEGILTNWITPKISQGFITEILGEKGSIEVETMSLLCEADCDITPIPRSIVDSCLQDIVCDERVFKNREDLRNECIFSIDPEGAKDLDDALSCRKLANGNFEVGVHISDVAFFIQQGTQFDQAICRKATTIYLVQRAYHMLPEELCSLCSLTPGEDKLAFSVFWELTPEAEIISHRFTRSIIHSCVQLTYAHAQDVIMNPGAAKHDFPPIGKGYSEKDCSEIILQLHRLATILRKNRFDSGSLKIEIPKLWFKLDSTSGLPAACKQYLQHESNWLIEEFMLLANFTVGKHIYKTYPDIALLRHHKPPNKNGIAELQKTLEAEDIFIDISSGAGLYQSINQFDGTDLESEAKRVILSNLVAKPMPKALYFASGLAKEPADYWHFALNAGYYTHFTSPIRRYADIIVHRLLAASLGYCDRPNYTAQEVQKAASISNKQKYCAKKAGESSSRLYLTIYLSITGPLVEKAAVLDVKDHSFDCIVLRFGLISRVYTNNLSGKAQVVHQNDNGSSSIFVYWAENSKENIKASIQLIKLFSVVTVELKKSENEMKLETRLLPFY